ARTAAAASGSSGEAGRSRRPGPAPRPTHASCSAGSGRGSKRCSSRPPETPKGPGTLRHPARSGTTGPFGDGGDCAPPPRPAQRFFAGASPFTAGTSPKTVFMSTASLPCLEREPLLALSLFPRTWAGIGPSLSALPQWLVEKGRPDFGFASPLSS